MLFRSTLEEQLEIVKWVIEHDMNYKGAADKYQIKYSLVYSWVRKYLKYGEGALEHKQRGPKRKNTIAVSNMGETERLKYELEREKALRKRAEFELEVLKKKREIEEKLRFRK